MIVNELAREIAEVDNGRHSDKENLSPRCRLGRYGIEHNHQRFCVGNDHHGQAASPQQAVPRPTRAAGAGMLTQRHAWLLE